MRTHRDSHTVNTDPTRPKGSVCGGGVKGLSGWVCGCAGRRQEFGDP